MGVPMEEEEEDEEEEEEEEDEADKEDDDAFDGMVVSVMVSHPLLLLILYIIFVEINIIV